MFIAGTELPRLHGWVLRPVGASKGTIIQFHGNAENISTHFQSVSWLPKYGYTVVVFDYRGYGISQGEPDLPGVITDGLRVVHYVSRTPDLNQGKIYLYGQSIGGAVAAYVGAQPEVKKIISGVILESAFSSYKRIVRDKLQSAWLTFPFAYPISAFFSDEFAPEKFVAGIAPRQTIFVASKDDAVVPAYHSQILHDLAGQPKQFWLTDAKFHVSSFMDPAMQQKLIKQLEHY